MGVYLVLGKHGEEQGGTERDVTLEYHKETGSEGTMHRQLKNHMTALRVSHLVGSASRNHQSRGFCLLLHGQDTKDILVALFLLPFSFFSPDESFLLLKREGTGKVRLVTSMGA